LQGPPGTGKTVCILSALSILVSQRQRVLVCSSSNHAVDVVARKVAKEGLIDRNGRPFRPAGIFFSPYDI
jgi:superfamily II DNA or RNA helicase